MGRRGARLGKLAFFEIDQVHGVPSGGAELFMADENELPWVAFGACWELKQGFVLGTVFLGPVDHSLLSTWSDLDLGVPGLPISAGGEVLDRLGHQEHGSEDQHGETDAQEGQEESDWLSNARAQGKAQGGGHGGCPALDSSRRQTYFVLASQDVEWLEARGFPGRTDAREKNNAHGDQGVLAHEPFSDPFDHHWNSQDALIDSQHGRGTKGQSEPRANENADHTNHQWSHDIGGHEGLSIDT